MMRRRGLAQLGGLTVVATALLTLGLASPTQAHDELEKSTPATGSTLEKLPAHATLVFSESLGPDDLTITADGTRLKVDAVPGKPATLKVDLRPVKPAKTVLLEWQAEDPHDGHESSGVIALHVEASHATGATANANAPPDDSRLITWVTVAARIVGYLAMAVFVGGLLFLSLLWPAGATERRSRLLLGISVAAGIAAAAASEAVVVWRSSGGMTLREALNEDFGRVTTAMALLWLLAAVVVAAVFQRGEHVVRELPWRVAALVVGAGLIRTTGMNAHATQGAQPTWGAAAEFLHLVGISAWVGGLTIMTVCLLPRRSIAELERIVPKFSTIAMVSVLVIVSSGLILSWQIISSVDGFWHTHYARVLFIKLALFATVLLAAMKSKSWVGRNLTSSTHRGSPVGAFIASVATETVLVIAVLGAASVLVTSSPGV
ncbi:copper resistance CopC/CopD family protein [Aeromicrobium ginsengisoli]|uniref:Copper resistance protein n=1 Tax=Aeromicrobium ginsengisoli TaxID=363867 RepID=A0A5M4FDS8_9ACTN|nr:CopD family protein [Aeromicrobium ginsengisoli]KAA1397399.1 copper resistance protein [Aeromicrobium ginsengisoli]